LVDVGNGESNGNFEKIHWGDRVNECPRERSQVNSTLEQMQKRAATSPDERQTNEEEKSQKFDSYAGRKDWDRATGLDGLRDFGDTFKGEDSNWSGANWWINWLRGGTM